MIHMSVHAIPCASVHPNIPTHVHMPFNLPHVPAYIPTYSRVSISCLHVGQALRAACANQSSQESISYTTKSLALQDRENGEHAMPVRVDTERGTHVTARVDSGRVGSQPGKRCRTIGSGAEQADFLSQNAEACTYEDRSLYGSEVG